MLVNRVDPDAKTETATESPSALASIFFHRPLNFSKNFADRCLELKARGRLYPALLTLREVYNRNNSSFMRVSGSSRCRA